LRKFSDQKLRVLTLILLLTVISLFNCLLNRLSPLLFTLQLSVSQIEQLTGLTFYSNLPLEVQQRIKSNAAPSSLNTSPTSLFNASVFSEQATIGHDGVAESKLITSARELTTSEISIGEVSPGHANAAAQAGTTQISSGQINKLQRGAVEQGITQIGVDKFRALEFRERQIAPTQVGIGQIAPNKFSFSQVGATEINASQEIFDDVNLAPEAQSEVTQIQIGEVSSSFAIEFPQFLSSHALHLQTSVDRSFNNTLPLALTPATLTSATTSPGTGLLNGSFNSTQLGDSNYGWDSRGHWTLPPTSSHPLGLQRNIENWGDWRSWQVNVDDLEELTGLDFLSNVSLNLQAELERRDPLAAPLFAQSYSVSPNRIIKGVSFQTGSFENGTNKRSTSQGGFIQEGIPEIGTIKTSITQDRFSQVSLLQIGSSQIGSFQVGQRQVSPTQIGTFQVGAYQAGIDNYGSFQIGSDQYSSDQIHSLHVGSSKDAFLENGAFQISVMTGGIGEVGSAQIGTLQLGPSKVNASEVSLSSSVTPQQLFTPSPTIFHDNLARISDSITTFWNRALAVDTPFELQLSFADLPSPQPRRFY
jgi:hypothetical protein